MHILERIGAVAPFLEKALGWRFGRSYYRGEQIFRLEMPHPPSEKYLPMYNLQQQYIEKYLHDAVAACDLIDMRWQSELAGIDCRDDGVRARYRLARRRLPPRRRLRAGRRRRALADPLAARPAPEGRQLRRPLRDRRHPHGSRLSDRAPRLLRSERQSRRHRADPQAARRSSGASTTSSAKARASRTRCARKTSAPASARSSPISATPNRGSWNGGASIPPTRCASTTTATAGCSSSAMPRISCRSSACAGSTTASRMPTISAGSSRRVLHGEADESLLDSYSPERRGATLDVFANATKSTRFMTPPTRGWRLAREAALSLSLKHEFPRGLANPAPDAALHLFGKSADAFRQPRRRVCVRARLRQRRAERQTAPMARYLLDRAGDGLTAILFCDGCSECRTGGAARPARASSTSALSRCWFSADGTAADAIADERRRNRPPVRRRTGTLYLLRPDLHIAGRWKAIVADEILRTAQLCLGIATP